MIRLTPDYGNYKEHAEKQSDDIRTKEIKRFGEDPIAYG